MPDAVYNQNFLETPDPVTGLQRRTGQNFLDLKQTIHERRVLEHHYDVDDPAPQTLHGIHREGSARAYVTDVGDADPTERPTGTAKNGLAIPAILLDDNDVGRLLIKEGRKLYYWKDSTDTWVKVDSTPVGMIQIWASPGTTPEGSWLKCDGTVYAESDYPELNTILGSTYGGDGISNFGVPDMQGISIVGSGQLDYPTGGVPGATATGRLKGNLAATVGLYQEDQIQTLEGEIGMFPVYLSGGSSNLVTNTSGIFVLDDTFTGDSRRLDRTTGERGNRGFRIDLSNADVRHGVETRQTSLTVDFYIKAL